MKMTIYRVLKGQYETELSHVTRREIEVPRRIMLETTDRDEADASALANSPARIEIGSGWTIGVAGLFTRSRKIRCTYNG